MSHMSDLVIGIMNEDRQLKVMGVIDPLAMARHWRYNNPAAYNALVELAFEDTNRGERPSIKLYFEILRRPWMANKLGLKWSDKKFKLNNNLHSEVARLIMEDHPNIKFQTRELRSDHWPKT